ncbi:unnamed protein product [Diabrotica balteata]|uniref:Non-structural maintenance of chromosomes element 4 n=1 Tax=Diabrotica balteata TaxID=107213 RepID=A0A9N9T3E7_DIABA|nr:unnamed protein product [Diabrotica balteata]
MEQFSSENQENRCTMRRNSRERKIIYRELLNKIEGIEETEDVSLNTVNEIGSVLREANSLDTECDITQRVGNADETFLDCLVLSSASSVLKRCVTAVDIFTSTYDSREYSNNIINNIKEENEEMVSSDLLKLLEDARHIIPQVPEYSYTYGAYDLDTQPQPKPRKERAKVVKEQVQKKEPERVTNLNKEEEAIEDIVKVFFQVLNIKYVENNEEPIPYYDYIIDTDDFANTVENIFYFSFLVRDGKASIDLNRKGDPIIKPVKKNVLKGFREEGGVNAQIITQINMEQWKRFKKPGYLQQHKKKP